MKIGLFFLPYELKLRHPFFFSNKKNTYRIYVIFVVVVVLTYYADIRLHMCKE